LWHFRSDKCLLLQHNAFLTIPNSGFHNGATSPRRSHLINPLQAHTMSAITFKPGSPWQQQFTFDHVKCLIVCRGPIRLEVIDIFESLGAECGILLSEKDSIVYPQTLAPELRRIRNRHQQVHHVPDYIGTTREERLARMEEIIGIALENGYTHVFAGYGFMAEDAEFVQRVEDAGLCFVGPNSSVIRNAGSKDEAKQLARRLGVSVTPGEDRLTARTLLRKAGEAPEAYLQELVRQHALQPATHWTSLELIEQAEAVLQASYRKRVDLFSIEELQREAEHCTNQIWAENPGKRIRFKHIGGGGGKGQRVVSRPEEVADAAMAVLIESRATGVGDNKTFLVELNIENTRHNEVQLLGNGEWCLELGGRDCSLQMHEQKLLEVSLTEELLEQEILQSERSEDTLRAEVLRRDLEMVKAMCSQAADFGTAIGLDSVSTFECIVEEDRHYFMEVNTRIQVEHRVTEMAYSLRFTNPEDPNDHFATDSLVAAMLLVACYGKAVPRPERILRNISGVEARINATNPALKPHAGGILRQWSEPSEWELRDDQGIGLRNPDSGLLQPYHLAGAYDSNVSLSVTWGTSRQESFERLAEVLRTTEVRGTDLHLNMDFHYGLLYWLLGNDPMVKPNTRFVQAYLALAGKLKHAGNSLNLELAWEYTRREILGASGKEAASVFDTKQTLILRPLMRLLDNPHLLMGWLAPRQQRRWDFDEARFEWRINPLEVLQQLYHYLRLEEHSNTPPSGQVWKDDQSLLQRGLQFYQDLKVRLGQPDLPWPELQQILASPEPPGQLGLDASGAALWERVQASNRGFQLGLQLLRLPVALGRSASYYDFKGTQTLDPAVPEEFQRGDQVTDYLHALAPPPTAASDEVLAWTGGTYYARETPDSEEYIQEGDHIETGAVLGLLEVMKMFNPIRAEFSGTVRKICVRGEGGVVVSRGQKLFEIDPDVALVQESDAERQAREQQATQALLQW
jgi:acetyl/propionyl-CoA carboxylase alpha subunit